jgi:hypothetical protein
MKKIATLVFALGWVAATLYTYQRSEPTPDHTVTVAH